VQVARPAKTGTVRLRFAKTSIRVLVVANPRVGEWVSLPKWEHQGVGGWNCKNRNSKAHSHKSESWVMARPAKTGMSGCRWLGMQKRGQ